MLAATSLDVPWLAAASTVHFAFAALAHHRLRGQRGTAFLPLISALLGAAPWFFTSLPGIIIGLGVNAAWFALCSRFSPAVPQPGLVARPVPERRSAPARSVRQGDARPKGFVQTPVLSVIVESSDIKTFRIARPDGFDFAPGQFLTVRMRVDGKDVVRCYSISSAPAARGYIEISVRRQGQVSNALHALARPGSLLSVRAPAGGFVYPDGDDRPLVLMAGGIGITPLMSMARHALLAEPTRPVWLLYSAKDLSDLAFRDELLTMSRRHEQLQVCFTVTRGAAPPDVYRGRIDEGLMRSMVPEIGHAVSMLCGPQSMIDGLTAVLVGMGVPKAQIRSERFDAAVAASVTRPGTQSRGATVETFQVRERRSARSVPATTGQTLLEAAETHGLDIPSLCRAGVCGTCRTRVVEGDVRCDGGVLDSDDRESGFVLACVASPQSDCVIEVA